jgi:hypothetical protein
MRGGKVAREWRVLEAGKGMGRRGQSTPVYATSLLKGYVSSALDKRYWNQCKLTGPLAIELL